MKNINKNKMPIVQAKEMIDSLKLEIKKHNISYYEKDESIISDFEYDYLLKELKFLESRYPELLTKDSPTQTVG